jgi:hypothetical protein
MKLVTLWFQVKLLPKVLLANRHETFPRNHGACDTVPLLLQEKLLPRVLLAKRHETFHREIMELVTLSLYCFRRSCFQGFCWPTGMRTSTGKS